LSSNMGTKARKAYRSVWTIVSIAIILWMIGGEGRMLPAASMVSVKIQYRVSLEELFHSFFKMLRSYFMGFSINSCAVVLLSIDKT